jgi:hypothetical protein
MKKAGLIVLFACVVLIPGAGYADEKRDQSNEHPPLKPPRSGHKALAEVKRPKPLATPAARLPPAIARNPRRGSVGSFSTVRAARIQNPIAGRSRPRPPSTAPPSLSNVRHRSPNPAVISGTENLSTRSTGAIDGRQVHRRP